MATEPDRPRAVVLDVDGTLYEHRAVRRGMLRRLALAHALRPLTGWRTLRALSAYRKSQEVLRAEGGRHADLGRAQIECAAERSGLGADEIAGLVARWMEEAPLDLVRAARRPGLARFLADLRAAGVGIGVFSDYPPEAKLECLGIAGAVDAVVWAQQPDVGLFKPDPTGIRLVLERLEVPPADALYVGDRVEVDAEAARNAGVACAILDPPDGEATISGGEDWFGVAGFEELRGQLLG